MAMNTSQIQGIILAASQGIRLLTEYLERATRGELTEEEARAEADRIWQEQREMTGRVFSGWHAAGQTPEARANEGTDKA